MTTTTKTPPKHGERRCYLAGCRLPECCRANYHYMCRYRLDRARNQNRRVDSAPVIEHVRSLVDSGWSRSQIATAATCSERTAISLYHGYYATIRADLAARILAAQPRIDIVKGKSYVDATGTIRRVRALIAIGHPVARIAAAIGVHRTPLGKLITHGAERVTAQLARDVAALYKRWAGQPGNNVRARNRAVAEGWHGPLAWDDIDDPNAQPDVDEHADKRGRPAKVDELRVARLVREGLTNDEIANRLGCHVRTISRARGRLTTNDLKEAA